MSINVFKYLYKHNIYCNASFVLQYACLEGEENV